MQGGKQIEESNMKKSKRIATVGHISSTFWSPFYAYYMLFRILGSQESNALNSVQIRAEMKKLWPLEDNHAKLKGNFASCKITKCKLRNQPFLTKWRLSVCKIFVAHVVSCEIHLSSLRYLLFKSPFSPCNPPIIGFLS